jgi:proteasome accessory factor B
MADRVERLTNLLALLLETAEPLSLIAIAGRLDGQYPDGQTAMRAAFERDKAALREIGVPIEQTIVSGGSEAGQTRYWIDRERYELTDLELDPDETRALQVAMAATRPGSASGQEAMWKIGAGLLEHGAAIAAIIPDDPWLPTLREAVANRVQVRFGYRDVDRLVDPWGLLLRTGFWYLIGFDHERDERRTYRIDRIEGAVEPVAGSTFERPPGFDASEAFPDDPKLIGADPNVPDALVVIEAHRAGAAVRELGADRLVTTRPDGSVEVLVPCANMHAFRSWLLGYGEYAEVLEPAAARAAVVTWLQAVAG